MNTHNAKIIILANKYPNVVEPNVNVFTQQVAWSLAELGYETIVICPTALNYNRQNATIATEDLETTENGATVRVHRPRYFGFGQDGAKLQKTRVRLTTAAFIKTVESVLENIDLNGAVLFGEFLCPAGVAASVLGKKHGIPSFMQCGEATYQGDRKYGNRRLRKKLLRDLTGAIALSGQNRDYLADAGVVPRENIVVLPSGYRKSRIYQRDKAQSRERLGLPQDKFIVGFCGSYDERKGVLRLEKAVDATMDPDVCLAAVGKGACFPTSEKCVLTGPLNHDELAWFYSAVDVFAFPTYHEGCCTAIVEAIACGCPIISSDRSFNYEICDNTNSILIDPDDIEAMRDYILVLKDNPDIRERLSQGSLAMGAHLSLEEKAKRLAEFMGIADDAPTA